MCSTGDLDRINSEFAIFACCAGNGDIAAADHHPPHVTDPSADIPSTGDAAAMVSQVPQHTEQGAVPSADVQESSGAAASMTAPSQHQDPQHALQTQQPQGQPAVAGAPLAEAHGTAPVASATPLEANPSLPPAIADEQAGASVAAAATAAEARAPVGLAADSTNDDAMHGLPPPNAPA